MDQNRQKSLTKAFITFQFSCFPLLWILHRRHIKIRINKTHERALKIGFLTALT